MLNLDPCFDYTWQTLPNPFLRVNDLSEGITGHISGRSADITYIITGMQSAILLMGAPSIGKSTLIRYLQRLPNVEWSWRNELAMPTEQLNAIHFVQVDLTPLEGIENANELLSLLIAQCVAALQSVYTDHTLSSDMKGLREFLNTTKRESASVRYFLMFDNIDRLVKPEGQLSALERVGIQQEHGLELLDHYGGIHTLVDLIDEFRNLGVIFSLQNLPRPNNSNQFIHISADLARFTNMTLQSFTWEDTEKFLAQKQENFGYQWAETFQKLGGTVIFSEKEQQWIREQAGTHPYLLHYYCLSAFRLKQEYAYLYRTWTELDERAKHRLTEQMNESLSTFFARTWRRLQEALEKSSQETRNNFYDFIRLLEHEQMSTIELAIWDQLGPELRYILYSEGIVRYNQFQDIHFPGSLLRNYLGQQMVGIGSQLLPFTIPSIPPPVRGYWLQITQPGELPERLSLTDLEYRLLRTLIEHEGHCTEQDLMMAGWERLVKRSTFTQRMHRLREKLKEKCREEIIINRYGGLYLLNHIDWFRLE